MLTQRSNFEFGGGRWEGVPRRSTKLSSSKREPMIPREKALVRNGKISASCLAWENGTGDRKVAQLTEASKGQKHEKPLSKVVGSSIGSERPAGSMNGHKRSYPTICDLGPEDKKRVRELIEQVARLGCEKENLEGEMKKERNAFQGLLETLQMQYHDMTQKKNKRLEAELRSLQDHCDRVIPRVTSGDALTLSSRDSNAVSSGHLGQPHCSSSFRGHPQEWRTTTASLLPQDGLVGQRSLPHRHLPTSHPSRAQNRPFVSPSCSSTTFTDVQFSPSRHFQGNRKIDGSQGISMLRGDTLSTHPSQGSTRPPHRKTNPSRHASCTPGMGLTSSPYLHSGARGVNDFLPKQRTRFPSVISTISSVSGTTDDLSTIGLSLTPQDKDMNEKNDTVLVTKRSKQPPEINQEIGGSGGCGNTKKSRSSSLSGSEAARGDICLDVSRTRMSSSSNLNRKVSGSTIDSCTQTVSVDSKAVQTESETGPAVKKPNHSETYPGVTSTFMPSAYVETFGNGIHDNCSSVTAGHQDTRGSSPCNQLCEASGHGSNHSHSLKQHCGSSLAYRHLSPVSAEQRSAAATPSPSVGYPLQHTLTQPPLHTRETYRQQDLVTGSHQLPHADKFRESPTKLNAATIDCPLYQAAVSSGGSIPSNLQTSSTLMHSTSVGHPSSQVNLKTTPTSSYSSSVGIGHDVLLPSSLLNLGSNGDQSRGSMDSHCGRSDQHITTKYRGQLDKSPNLNTSLDIAFSLNCGPHSSPDSSPPKSTTQSSPVHVRITSPNSNSSTAPHKDTTSGQHWPSPAKKSPSPSHSSVALASSLNQYFDDGRLSSCTGREQTSNTCVSCGGDQSSDGVTQSDRCSANFSNTVLNSELRNGDDNLVDKLFFIQ